MTKDTLIRKILDSATSGNSIEAYEAIDSYVKQECNLLKERLNMVDGLLNRAYGFNHEDMGWDVAFEDYKELPTL